jgi:hypothetical protein
MWMLGVESMAWQCEDSALRNSSTKKFFDVAQIDFAHPDVRGLFRFAESEHVSFLLL